MRPPRRVSATARHEEEEEGRAKEQARGEEEEGALTFYSKLSGVTTERRPNRLLPRIEVHTYKKLRLAPSGKGGREEEAMKEGWPTGCSAATAPLPDSRIAF